MLVSMLIAKHHAILSMLGRLDNRQINTRIVDPVQNLYNIVGGTQGGLTNTGSAILRWLGETLDFDHIHTNQGAECE